LISKSATYDSIIKGHKEIRQNTQGQWVTCFL
jgi:hypothetical protein